MIKRTGLHKPTSTKMNLGQLREIVEIVKEVTNKTGPGDVKRVGFQLVATAYAAVEQIKYSGELFRWRERFKDGAIQNVDIYRILIRYDDVPMLKHDHWIIIDFASVEVNNSKRLLRLGDMENIEGRGKVWQCFCAAMPKDQEFLRLGVTRSTS